MVHIYYHNANSLRLFKRYKVHIMGTERRLLVFIKHHIKTRGSGGRP